ncbi:MAG: hybrid sensor histidine kinase/response regulator [Bacteroidota bacterium]
MKDYISVQNPPNILIVDDIPENLKILADILEDEGYKVRPVLNGIQALQVAEKEKPDIILLDILMPGMDGFEVCQRLKESQNLNDVPIIFISALSETNNIVNALKSGGADYIIKPFRAEEVKARVATHLKLFQQRQELLQRSDDLQKLNAEKDKFFSIIAHDLRSPFHGFLGLTQIIAEELSNMTLNEIQKIAVTMRNSATNMFRLLENLLEWAQMAQGLIPFNPEVVHLPTFMRKSLSMSRESAISKGIELTSDIPDELMVFADPNMLQTIIRNLVSNAVKFTSKGGTINVSAKAAGDSSVEISIKDDGIGMNTEMLGDLFRLDVKTNRDGAEGEPSAGLGLILCKDFIERHGGKLSVESEEGKGSRFSFSISMNSEQSAT